MIINICDFVALVRPITEYGAMCGHHTPCFDFFISSLALRWSGMLNMHR